MLRLSKYSDPRKYISNFSDPSKYLSDTQIVHLYNDVGHTAEIERNSYLWVCATKGCRVPNTYSLYALADHPRIKSISGVVLLYHYLCR